MQSYNEINRHERDYRLDFDAESHTYLVDDEVFESVTTVVESLFEQFDADYWAARKATARKPAEVIKAEWAAKGKEARDLGTLMHDRIERYYLGEAVDQWIADPTFCRFCDFTWKYRLVPARSEWRIFHEEARIAGTLDFLAANPDGTCDIWDWKRSTKVTTPNGLPIVNNAYGKRAFAPLTHLPDTTFYHYALQVSIYRYILETKYDISIRSCHLGVFHPEMPRYAVVDLPYLHEEVEAIFSLRR